jgi:transposase InsO family protein
MAKHEHCKSPRLLSPLPIPSGSWQDVSMDFIEGLPLSDGCSVILVVIDRFTKYGHFFPLKHPFTATTIAHTFLNNVVKLHGLPNSVVLDRDKVFTSTFWKTLFSALNIDLKMSSAYHPQTNGKTERVNQCLEMYLRCSISSTPKCGLSGFLLQSCDTTPVIIHHLTALLSRPYMGWNQYWEQSQCLLQLTMKQLQ